VGCQTQEHPPLAVGLEHEPEPSLLEVPEPAVDQPARAGAGAGAEVALFHQHRPEAPHGGVACDPRAGDAAADDQEIRRVRGQRTEPGAP
jgi:hypothetical protein